RIYIYVTGAQRRDYFSAVLHSLREINGNFEKLNAVEKICMPDKPGIAVAYDHLLWMEQSGMKQYAAEGARKVYDVSHLLGTVDKEIHSRLVKELKNEFFHLSKKAPQRRGFDFEVFLNRMFDVYQLSPRSSFKNIGEQIDGSFQMGNDTYLVEAKWYSKPVAQPDLLVFDGKITSKASGTRGLFISISGYTKEAIQAFKQGRSTSIIAMDRADLEYILEGNSTLPEAVALKRRYAAETNEFFKPLQDLKKKYHYQSIETTINQKKKRR
ncbi:MAG: restriction endonuclease, partial [bacterium]|nr:restriction endonuclease [bacterium]